MSYEIHVLPPTNLPSESPDYFTYRVTTSVIEGINNSIKTVKRMGYGFPNFVNSKQRVLISFAWLHKKPRRAEENDISVFAS